MVKSIKFRSQENILLLNRRLLEERKLPISTSKRGDGTTYFIVEFLQELNLIHQRLNLPLQLQTGQCGIIHILPK